MAQVGKVGFFVVENWHIKIWILITVIKCFFTSIPISLKSNQSPTWALHGFHSDKSQLFPILQTRSRTQISSHVWWKTIKILFHVREEGKRERSDERRQAIRLKYSRYSRHLMLCFASSHFIISFLAHVVCSFFSCFSSVVICIWYRIDNKFNFYYWNSLVLAPHWFLSCVLDDDLSDGSGGTNKVELVADCSLSLACRRFNPKKEYENRRNEASSATESRAHKKI